jgi:ATP-binding cassette subfamily F protein 3
MELSRGKLTQFSGDIEAFLEHKEKCREHDEKVNETILAKRKKLQRFIDKNRARPSTATQARSKQRQLDRLQLIEIDAPETTARIHVPDVPARKGPALLCKELAIGYEDLTVASGINLDIQRGDKVVVVGDNGQGKTTFLRTVAGHLTEGEGEMRWSHGTDLGYYAQRVYADLKEEGTVLEYLEQRTSIGTPTQAVLDTAGGFLFRGDEVEKRIPVLSGGERARLCLAGLLLGGHNVLVLDEPGNHLDIESVEGLSEALARYRGTVIFTSHDRHFMERIASHVVEVRDGRIVHYPDGYDAYLWRVRREIEEGVRTEAPKAKPRRPEPTPEDRKAEARRRHALGKALRSVERQLERLEDQKADLEGQLPQTSDLLESQRIHEALVDLDAKIAEVEKKWVALQEQWEKG